jgi:hypothetical protein
MDLSIGKLLPNGGSRDLGASSPSFRCGASIFCTQGRVQGLPAVGRPGEDAGDAAHGSVTDTAAATFEAAGDGQERDLDLLHVALVQWIPRPVNRRRDPAGGEAQRARPGRVVLAAARGDQLGLAK